jgi:hypothetical protein
MVGRGCMWRMSQQSDLTYIRQPRSATATARRSWSRRASSVPATPRRARQTSGVDSLHREVDRPKERPRNPSRIATPVSESFARATLRS